MFSDVGPDVIKIVIATNIAETSVTIPGVVAVIDAGRVKEVRHAGGTQGRKGGAGSAGGVGSSALVEDWCSMAACRQRAGRAGRTRPGVVCRLFSRQTFEGSAMPSHSTPELQRVPLER